jgi:hypothetical protein
VGAITLEEGISEYVIIYASKELSQVHSKVIPLYGRKVLCIHTGIFHFHEFLYRTHFTLHINYKLLEWLAIMPNAYGKLEM